MTTYDPEAIRHRRRRRRAIPVSALAIGALAISLFSTLGVTPARADTTAPSAVAFDAQPCVGITSDDPTDAAGPVPNLTLVFGQRLLDYQAGNVVALYDSFGVNNIDAYPPVCGVRFVEGIGPVSEWMFCTDIHSHACAGTDADGNLLGIDGKPIDPMENVTGNPKLDAQQEKLIAWLIQNGHSYSGTGYYNWGADSDGNGGVTEGSSGADSASYNRLAVQTLIWCVSDAPSANSSEGSVADRFATCDDNMDAAEQARILAMIPDAPQIALSFSTSGEALELGDSATFALTTNLYNQPIALTSADVAGVLAVVDGPATLTDGVLTVTGTDPVTSSTIRLSFTSTAAGTVNIAAAATPASTTHIVWNQSPSTSASPGQTAVPCQVFATFHEVNQLAVSDAASATFRETTGGGGDGDGGTGGGTGGGDGGGTGGGDGGTGGGTGGGDSGTGGGTGGTGGGTGGGTDSGMTGTTTAVSSTGSATTLAETGTSPAPLIVWGLLLAGGGALALLTVVRRRRQA